MKYIAFPVLILFLFLTSCTNKETVTLDYTNAEGRVSTLGNLNFTFNQDLVTDSILYYWDTTSYVVFDPPIKGVFQWTDYNHLTFSSRYSLSPATKYTATITDKVLKHSSYKKLQSNELSFYTEQLAIEDMNTYWRAEKEDEYVVRIDLDLNYAINVGKSMDYIEVFIDNEEYDFSLLSFNNTSSLQLELSGIQLSEDDYEVEVRFLEGIVVVGSSYPTNETLTETSSLKSAFNVEILDVSSDHNGITGTIEVFTSQEVSDRNIKDFILIDPDISFDVNVENNGFKIISDELELSKTYSIIVLKDLMGKIAGKLNDQYETVVEFGDIDPVISFEYDKGFYLSGKGEKNMQVRIVNVPKVKVTISKLYESNLMAAADFGYFDYYNDFYYDGYDYYYGPELEVSDVIWQEEIETNTLPKQGINRLLTLDFKDKLPEYNGIYSVQIESSDDYWLYDSRLLSISDIGLIAKQGLDDITVFANSIQTTQSLSNVRLTLIGTNNQIIDEATTNANGVATFQMENKEIKGFTPAFITAKKSDDFNVLAFDYTDVSTSRFSVGGYRDAPNGLQTYIYFERDIYRPGEKVHFASIVRNKNWNSPGTLPVRVEITLPNGKELKNIKKTLNQEGSFDGSFQLAAEAVTGSYTVYVYTSNDVLLASKSVMVEEFMPDRIKVSTTLSDDNVSVGETTDLMISAQNLFGSPAANRNYEVEFSFRKRYFSPKGFSSYTFNLVNAPSYFNTVYREGETDELGEAIESFEVPESYEQSGVLQADVYTTVFDETGRPVNKKNTLEVYTQDVFYGLGYVDYYSTTNRQINIPIVAIDKAGNTLQGVKAHVQIIKHEYKTVLNKSGGYYRYESQPVEKHMVDKEITLGLETVETFIPTISGNYEIRLYSPEGGNRYVSQRFYCYGYGNTYLSSFDVNNEGHIDIEFDKERYNLGESESARILFKTPFKGKLLVTIEGENVMEHKYVQTDERSAEVVLPLSEKYIPNVYVSAVLIKPHDETEFPLTVAHGYKPLYVEDDKRDIPVEITSVEESRSKTQQTIHIQSSPNSYVSLAVVDEGILQVTGFDTPDPYSYFYQKRALRVQGYDVYPYLFPEISADNANAGGAEGGTYDLAKRVNPLQNDRVKLVSFWSGLLKTDASGKTSYTIDIPQFSGNLRLMAVSHKGNTFGSADENIIVADPIVLSSSIPRFLSPGDTAVIATTLSNTEDVSTSAQVTMNVEGALQLVGTSNHAVSIDANSEQRVEFVVVAKKEIGKGKFTVVCDAFQETFEEETDITVRPASPLLKTTGSGTVKEGSPVVVQMNQAHYIPESADYTLVVSKNPMVEFMEDIDYLVRYPYGCTEQTISSVFPQLYYADLAKAMHKEDANKAESAHQNIIEAMNRLKMRQLYNGALSMWGGSGSENWWVSVYAAHFMVEAQKAGYEVDEDFVSYLLTYLYNRLKSKETVDYYYNRNQYKKIVPKEVPYSLYVLALAGKPDIALMNYYKSNTTLLSLDGKYLLAASYVLAGDMESGRSILPGSFEGEESIRQFGGSFYSPIRDEAIALNALLDADPNHNQIGIMTRHVSEYLKTKKYLNTQERIFSLLALGKIAKRANQMTVDAVVKANGETIGTYTKGVQTYHTDELNNKEIKISVKGDGTLYYFWEAEGISKDGSYVEEDSYIKVRRYFYDRYGRAIKGNQFQQNDLVVVKIVVESDYDDPIENVVISDILPAGFEIENPRTDEIPGTEWISSQNYPDHRDIRDDRIHLFDDIYSYDRYQVYYYVVRAVSTGTFHMGPVAADAMYNAEYHSYHGGGIIRVVPKE